MITAWDVLTTGGKHEDRAANATEEHAKNATDLSDRVNRLFADQEMAGFGPIEINDGYRDESCTYGAARSSHKEGRAIDIRDPKQRLGVHLVANQHLLERYGLWLESPKYTRTWCHLQSRPVRGRRVFIP